MLKLKSIIFIVILFLSLLTKGQQQDGSVLEKRVTIIQKDLPLSEILNQISWQAGVYFSYDASVVDAEKKYDIDVANKSLFTVLQGLFDTGKLNISEKENQIIISEITDNKDNSEIATDSIPIRYFFLKGKITDISNGESIPYATISVQNKPIGTVSNKDGEFLLKLHPDLVLDTIMINSLGYAQLKMPASELLDDDFFSMEPSPIRIKEIKVTGTTPQRLLKNIRDNIKNNYPQNQKILTGFYRETMEQDDNYVSVSEAITEILKAPYQNSGRNDLVKILKGRRSVDVEPYYWLNLKMQGGPYTITKLDIVKNMENFINEEYEDFYRYKVSKVIRYNDFPVYVLQFRPKTNTDFLTFTGEIYVHQETFAIVHAEYQLNNRGLKTAENIFIRRKPAGVKASPIYVNYQVNYQEYEGKWHLANARASVTFKIRDRRDNINSEYQSVSELLVTNIEDTDLKRFNNSESFTQRDIFVDMIGDYDESFWENYNIIKPDEDLKNALKNITMQ